MGKKSDMDVTQMRLPIAVVIAIIAQSGAGIWYFAQQNATIATMENTIAQLEENSMRMIESIESDTRDWVNLQRDVKDNMLFINDLRDDVSEENTLLQFLRADVESILRKIAQMEIQIRYLDKDHTNITMDQAARAATSNDKDYGHPVAGSY